MQFDFSKKFTGFLKGIAIILMIIHHAFGFPEWYVNELCYPSLIKFVPHIRQLSVICVGIFAFITGYIYSFNKENNYKYSFKKIIFFLKDYWTVYAFLLIIAVIFCNYRVGLLTILKEMFAIEMPVMNFCWYVAFYICVMIVLPFYTRIIKNKYIIVDFLIAALFIIVLDKISHYSIFLYYLREYVPILLCGYIIGKYKLFEIIYNRIIKLPLRFLKISGIVLIVFSLVLQTYKLSLLEINISAYSVPIFVFGLYLTDLYRIKFIDNVVLFLGKHSMNIWFIHCIFYSRVTCTTFQKYAYIPKNPIIVIIWILLICSTISIFLDYVKRVIKNF